MLDEYVSGKCHRVSPEAPVPVILNPETEYVLGGAGNVLANVLSLGAQAQIFTVISDDDAGIKVTKLIEKITGSSGTLGGTISTGGRPTTRKQRIVANGQQVARIDYECTDEFPFKANQWCGDVLHNQIKWADLVIVSDYGKGLITEHMMSDILISCRDIGVKFIVDPKGKKFYKYKGAEVITPNEKELNESDYNAQHYSSHILMTAGSRGVVLSKKGIGGVLKTEIPAEAKAVCDVSGAGDTVIAALGVALATGCSLEESARFANKCAGIVVGKPGTATVVVEDIG